MINLKKIISPILISLCLGGCIEPMEIENDANRFQLVVDGKITQNGHFHKLYLNRTSGYGYNKRIHVSGARIRLYNSRGEYETYFEDPHNELYVLPGYALDRKPGESYYVEINLNEKIYRSKPQIMPQVVLADTILAKPSFTEELNESGNTIRRNYVNIYLQTPVNKKDEDLYFIWRAEEAYSFTEIQCHPLHNPKICYIKRPINGEEIKIFSTEKIAEGTLKDFLITRVYAYPNWEFYEKHFYNVAQHSITHEAYEYWRTVKEIAQPTGSIFDTPPAPIPGNIYNLNDPAEQVLGFFEVSAVDTVRTYTFYYDLEPLAIIDRCPSFNWKTYNDPPCCNCLILENSSTERPSYWGE